MDISNLKVGQRYIFRIKPFETALDVLPGEAKTRTFVGIEDIGPVGMAKEPFVEVERDNGKRHLIAVSTIEAIEPV
ncbi:hypothetical protein [Burkholderia contaminans]|uniref:hypothetical protein n=1 Tax=Burkholderia contaminans TaxID=488447 RepID=UPI002D7FA7DF|nr:hypothetical protein [Burkholderia contaminans]